LILVVDISLVFLGTFFDVVAAPNPRVC